MLNDALKAARSAKGLTQEELAHRLNVVRQTVSKWEMGLSVPDADVLVEIATALDVPVSQLPGMEAPPETENDLANELAEVNELLAKKSRQEKLYRQANRQRELILFFSFAAMASLFGDKKTAYLRWFNHRLSYHGFGHPLPQFDVIGKCRHPF